MLINIQQACSLLREHDHIVILAHQKPDGDTLGSCFALLLALEALGKTARVESPDGFPARYDFLCGGYAPKEFSPEFVVSADVASLQLLGDLAAVYGSRMDLCIDHHKSNELFAAHTLLDAEAPAASQIVYHMVRELGAELTPPMANALFTGISTDTGCFKYDNVTPLTHRVAAALIEAGAEHGAINKLMFDTKSKGRIAVEGMLLDNLEYYFDDQCAVLTVYPDTPDRYGVNEDELDGLSALPRRIEGVKAGVTIREKEDGSKRISLRTGDGLDASTICSRLGGGGHKNAAGCTIHASREEAKRQILAEIWKELETWRYERNPMH